MRPGTALLIVGLALGTLTAALASDGQQSGTRGGEDPYRVGYLCNYGAGWQGYLPFVRRLNDLGYVTTRPIPSEAGRYLKIEFRGCAVTEDYLRDMADQLVRSGVDVIVAPGAPALRAAREATRAITTPIVFVGVDDPVASGFVASLERPGGNITGVSSMAPALSARRLALLKETIPELTRVAVLLNRASAATPAMLAETTAAARASGIQLQLVEIRDPGGAARGKAFDRAFSAITRARADALLVLPDALFTEYRGWVLAFAWTSRLPAMYRERDYVASETPQGLMSYGPDPAEQHARVADYVDKILNGVDPAELPVARPRKFNLVINLKTAKELGLRVPTSVLAQATEVIE